MGEGRDYKIGKYITRPLIAAETLTKDHLVLSIDANGDVLKCTNTALPYAIATRSTQDKVARTAGLVLYKTGTQLEGAEIPMFKSGIAELPLGSDNLAIKVGDRIVVHADDDGTVNGAVAEDTTSAATLFADQELTVGYAEEVVALNAGGTVLVALKLYKGDAP